MSNQTSHPLGIDLNEFPVREEYIYLNHAGTSPIPRRTAEMFRLYGEEAAKYGSARYGNWEIRLGKVRQTAARMLGCDPSEIALAKSTTLGLNNVAYGLDWKPGDVVIVEENTFPANWLPWIAAERDYGIKRRVWPERDYRYNLEDLEDLLRQGSVRLVAATSANFSTGFRQDLAAIGELCRKYGALFCLDAIQTLGVFPINVKELGVDFLSADSHKWLLGPEGAGIFYVSRDKLDLFKDTSIGWMGRENFTEFHRLDLPPDPTARRFEEGSPNMGGFMAMGESLNLLLDIGAERISTHNRELCKVLEDGLEAQGWTVMSQRGGKHASSIVTAQKEGIDTAAVAKSLLKNHGVFCVYRRGFLRMSPHLYETVGDMEETLGRLEKAVADLKA
ncbi:MAG: aminotransferase class V-fold PLP-dependent enzyme [Candidatus Sumerlaeia bacterium]|nr:aminotransferase class V-fold PLP-dependent enzyme [Candidatus Sumerlaeia bacterium]